jgi:hypothetical protein
MMQYDSLIEVESRALPGTRVTVRKMSFMRRLELAENIRELANRIEYLEAGSDPKEKMQAATLSRELDRIYLRWGLVRIDGLEIDGSPATPEVLVRDGPEALVEEALEAIRAQCGLSQEERKN